MVSGETVQSALGFLSHRRITIFGRPSRLITDNGGNIKGEISAAFVGVWHITHVCNPAYSAYQGGVFERTVGMLKAGVHAIANHDPSTQWIDAVSLAVAGRNLSPLSECGLAPLTIMTGRRNILDFATEHDFANDETACASIHVPRQESNLQNILIARASVIQYESEEIVRKCLTRNLRARSQYEFRKDQPVESWQGSQWLGGYRFLARIHHNGIAECGNRLVQIPLCNLRPLPSTIIAEWLEDSKGVVDLDPIAPSNTSWVQHVDSAELLLGAESAYRFPEVYALMDHPLVNPHGLTNPHLGSVLAVTRNGINSQLFPDDGQDAFDPSRLPPRIYLEIREAVDSIRKETEDITSAPKDGIPPLSLVRKSDQMVGKLPRIRSTLVVRKKSIGVWKSTICHR